MDTITIPSLITTDMEKVPSLVGTSVGSPSNESTGLLTPDASPLFRPSHAKDTFASRLAKILDQSKPRKPQLVRTQTDDLVDTFSDSARPQPRQIKRICVIGAGYVGGPTAAVLALYNPDVRIEVLDRDQRRIDRWQSGHLPIHEPGLNNIVRATRDASRRTGQDEAQDAEDVRRQPNLFFTTNSQESISNADMILLAVNTPTKMDGVGAGRATNMRALDGSVNDVALYAKPGTILVEKSTVPCGTAQRIRKTLDSLRPGEEFEILSNPEFLAEGTAVKNLMNPDRVIIGSADTPSGHLAAAALASLYAAWIPTSQIVTINAWSSELCKLVANAMLAQRITSINSVSAICEATGANVDEVAKSIGLDKRIGPQFLKAGLGFGGSCFRKDIASLTYLAESLGLDEVAEYWDQVNTYNELQRKRFARKVVKRYDGDLSGKKLAILGFAFKKDTGDARESPAADVIKTLYDEQPAEIAIFDPYCNEEDILREIQPFMSADNSMIKIYADPYQACSGANAILVVNENDQFKVTAPRRSGSVSGQITPLEKSFEEGSISSVSDTEMLSPVSPPVSQTKPEKDYLAGFDIALVTSPPCLEDCPDCKTKARGPVSTDPVEWARIVYNMKEPKWVFDGRGILNIPQLEALGDVKVDAIGKARAEDSTFCY
ncbi:hypothetical protein LTR10_019577 [Elasticomyces elasticus]|uniref:UDP-glucose 6-dehydrogenase n=1 Tax=Exophiala sideris TaxID=1016849 RepID=A0ABR0JPC5_9EURO|nr:hypothetical protein LTR10_019577 [Elasticomyces elasticus]KAK5038155.1 hypothetical protein LTS07_001624 [Exophiala sideris]KAK5044139.1 hypothetical protein LTR13_000495 [Exophiala sideris]KAK5067639.1 hypothetical protein LTR69_001628 [Exophiala sideris]KAK5184120.1 hypothetical protein LTR44_003626 [Eurotiomycetes sp. CCFEE 6388]